MSDSVVQYLYLISAVLFIFGLKGLTKVKSARRGNQISAMAMLLAVIATFIEMNGAGAVSLQWIIAGLVIGGGIGAFLAVSVKMTSMPEMVAFFNGSGGIASALVALSNLWFLVIEPAAGKTAAQTFNNGDGGAAAITTVLSIVVGAVTLSGSVVAWGKLAGWMPDQPVLLPGRHFINLLLLGGSLGCGGYALFTLTDGSQVGMFAAISLVLSLLLGVGLVIGIGGADMPVVISLLNSYSGVAASMTGFVLGNKVLIISGALVGASGLILTYIMCVAMNRTLTNVLFGGFGAADVQGGPQGGRDYGPVRSGGPEEAAMLLEAAETVAVVPGYGLAVAQAQHTIRELSDLLQKDGKTVTYGIHPVAGRMPGHMNVLLAEADVPYDQLLEMDTINPEFKNTDVCIVLGANDVVNPAAIKDPASPIAGMPILTVHEAGTVIVIKRSLSPGFAKIKNELFEYKNTMMLFADAKKALQEMIKEYKDL